MYCRYLYYIVNIIKWILNIRIFYILIMVYEEVWMVSKLLDLFKNLMYGCFCYKLILS